MKLATAPIAEPAPIAVPLARLADYAQLVRPRIAVMVLVTVVVGGLLASVGYIPVSLWHAALGVGLVSASASALNQYLERDTDALMPRTADRPLPAGRLSMTEGLIFSALLGFIGFAYLLLTLQHPLAILITALTFASYIGIYTPLKRYSDLNTLVGAVPGALPPVIGWAAVRGELGAGAWALFLIVFFWQVPHFLAIAWLYRDDYAAGGLKMLTANDPAGDRTARQMLIYLLALIPVSLLPAAWLGLGWGYAAGAASLAWLFLRPVLRFGRDRSHAAARAVLRASLLYLPALLGWMVVTKTWTSFRGFGV